MKELSKTIMDLNKLPYKHYESRSTKRDPTDSYFYLARHLAKYMMQSDALNSHVYPVRTEMVGTKHIPILHIRATDESKS